MPTSTLPAKNEPAKNGRRAVLASTIALAALLAIPVLPSSFSADATALGAAFARRGADDGANDNGHHTGAHQRHGNDDGANHDANDDHPGKHRNRGGR
jgi:hypothetical protein